MNLRETGYEGMDWIQLAQDRVQRWVFVNIILNFGSIKTDIY